MSGFGNYGAKGAGFTAPTGTGTPDTRGYGTFVPSTAPGFGQQSFGSTFLPDLFARPDFKAAVLEEYYYRSAFVTSGIIQRNTALDMSQGGIVVEMPYFKAFDPYEEAIESNTVWGVSGAGHLTPQKIGTDSFRVPVVHRGFAAAVDNLSRLGSGEDPMAAIRSYIANAMSKFRHNHLIALLDGLFDRTAGVLRDNTVRTAFATDATANTAAGALMSTGTIVQAQNKLGERGADLTAIAMHSAVRNWLVQMGMLTFSSPAGVSTSSPIVWGGGGVGVTNSSVGYFGGLQVIVDDRLTPRPLDVSEDGVGTAGNDESAVYPCYAFGQGVIQEGIQQNMRIATDNNILSMQDILAADWHYAMGVAGVDYTGTLTAASTGANSGKYPLNADIATASNYGLKYDKRMIPVVKVECQTPYGELMTTVA